jgi:hypothetical protein
MEEMKKLGNIAYLKSQMCDVSNNTFNVGFIR